ncbi:hypothetical protein HPB50_009068 [Hyalomma asiaticum]|uniref:Uncharacterized protein n=1 Tax=Hyalomma asiaticum TaxID=266040 RepID=A0ACB7SC68_HYAAI|nr:hypothetical protein HPB50_009068 [Hyalomma asiaticum]
MADAFYRSRLLCIHKMGRHFDKAYGRRAVELVRSYLRPLGENANKAAFLAHCRGVLVVPVVCLIERSEIGNTRHVIRVLDVRVQLQVTMADILTKRGGGHVTLGHVDSPKTDGTSWQRVSGRFVAATDPSSPKRHFDKAYGRCAVELVSRYFRAIFDLSARTPTRQRSSHAAAACWSFRWSVSLSAPRSRTFAVSFLFWTGTAGAGGPAATTGRARWRVFARHESPQREAGEGRQPRGSR